MIYCLKRLKELLIGNINSESSINDTNFIVYMDRALDLLSPISLQWTYSSENETNVEITETNV